MKQSMTSLLTLEAFANASQQSHQLLHQNRITQKIMITLDSTLKLANSIQTRPSTSEQILTLFIVAIEISLKKERTPSLSCVLPSFTVSRVKHGIIGHILLEQHPVERRLINLVPKLAICGREDMLAHCRMTSSPDLTPKEDKATHSRVQATTSSGGCDFHERLKTRAKGHETKGKEGRNSIVVRFMALIFEAEHFLIEVGDRSRGDKYSNGEGSC